MASTKESSLNLLINTCKDADNQENRSVYDDREKIRYLLESNLTKPNSQSLLITLKWSLYLLESKPAIFVHIHQEHGIHHSDADTRENATQSSQAFTEWFLLHMVHLLSQTNPPVEHARCIDVAIQLLKVIRRRDRYFYRKVLTSFVHFMAGMIKISEALYDDIDHEPIEAKLFLVSQEELRKSFLELEKRERGDIKVTPLSFLIKDVDVCDLIQLNIMKLFQPFASDIFHVSAPLGPLTWTSVCCQLELGDASLKVESLEVIKILLRAGGLVDFNILDYCISCVIALIEVLLIGTLEIDEHLVIALEEKTAEVLCQLKVADLKPLKGISTTLPKNKLVKDIANMLEVNKFTNLKTGKMKQAITDILAYSLFGDCEPVKMMRRRTNLADIDKVLSVLMWQLGKSPRQQYLVGLLSKIICSEFKQTEKPESVQLKAAEESSGTEKSSKLRLQQQRRKRTADGDFKMRETKPLMSHEMVLKKLILFLDSELTEDNCVCVLEAVRAAVEVLCVCAVTTRIELVERLCHWWKKCLRNCLQWNNEVINRCLSVMMQTMGTLLASNGKFYGVDWCRNDPSWLDLKPIDSRDVAKLSNNLSEKIDCKEICDSLRFLSLLPKEVAPKWRVHVLKQACTDSREEVRKAVTNIFPTVLLHLGPNANHLVYELLHPLVLDRDSELQKTVAGVLGYLACVVSRKAVLRRVLPGDNHKPLYEYLKIKCTACDTFDDMEELGSPKGRPKLIDPNMFSPFLVFLQSEDQVTKTEFIQSLKRIFGHIGVRSNNTAIVNMLNSCLVLIEDPNYQVRMEFSEVLRYLVGDLSSDGTSATDQLIVRRLKEAIIRARSEQGKDISLQETIVHTLGQLGRVAESDLLLVVIISLLESLLSEVSLVAATAYKQLQKVAQYKKKSPQILFMKSRQQICRFLVDQIHDAQVQVKGQGTPVKHKPVRILQEVAKVLDFQDIKSFLQVAEKFMVPHLVAKATPEASSLVKMMATHLSLPSRKKLLMNNTKYIFSYLVRSCQKVDLEKAIRYLQNETELELGNLLRIHFQSVHNVLLLHLSSNYMQVFNGLKILSSYDENYKGPKEITTGHSEQMADFLQPRLLGVLAFFDSQLLNSNITMDEKKLTLEALIAVIKLMGPKHITTIRYKVMNTLRIGLQFKDREFMELSCKAWNSLVRSLEPQFLGQMLSQIIATLLPLSKQLPQAVTEIFNYLIIDNRAGYLQAAYSSLLQASDYNRTDFFLEKAKLLWEKGDDEQALSCLERGMSVHFPDAQQLKLDTSQQSKEKRQILAQALLLYGRYSEEKSNLESNAIVRQYKEVIEMNSEWEDGHFHLAKYYDRIMTTLIEDKDRPELTRQGDFVLQIVKFFGQSLQYGNQFIYQSMPRLLSLWLDYGTAVVETEKKDRSRSQDPKKLHGLRTTLSKLNKTIDSLGQKLAPYQFFTAFSQLISRICHTQPDVFQQLQQIMARILVQFPQQALWMMMAVSKSSYPMRVKRCHEIFATAKALNSEMNKLIQDSTKLTDKLLELCEKDFPQTTTLSVTQHFRPLKRLLEDSHFSSILLPLQSAMTVSLPNTAGSHFSHNPFPENQVYIRGFEDPIEILPSLQKPKKITMSGSDGHLYVMMCKPKDDLRKDCRLMEFNAIVNKFLRKDPESRKRQLHIRTYTVIPLNEECGLIEWVNNTSGLRHILMKLYKEKGMYTSGRELKAMMPSLQSSIETKLQIYKQKLLPRHPPVFKEWYLRTFPDPTSWYNARLAYARTVAVMSMVGYILGLGDRHGENILFDSTTGDCVHVDFNCLFNKGETFEWPERVPFRLTPNMIDAMGPMGIEGIFRRACEVTLRVMRNQMDPLMSVLRPFVYDPLVEWSKPARGQRPNPSDSGEITNEQALTHVQNIEDRMKGILKNKTKPRGLPLSIEGHVNYLIQEATDDRTNCQMYIGWAAYL
ncbi:hypothetical protein ScPMuIL_018026 [Solemya velum]